MYGGLYGNYGGLCQILLSSMRSFLPYVLNRIEDKLMIKYKELNHEGMIISPVLQSEKMSVFQQVNKFTYIA